MKNAKPSREELSETRLADAIAAEVIRLLNQPNSIGLPEDVRVDLAVIMACEKYRANPEQFLEAV
jgi:hypothetical protein